MKKYLASDFAETYAGQWPKAITHLLLVMIGGPLIAAVLFAEPIAPRMFLGSFFVAVGAFVIAVRIKKRARRNGS